MCKSGLLFYNLPFLHLFNKWMKLTLKLAAIYNILLGAWVVLFPNHFFDLVGMVPLNHLMVWQGMGIVLGIYGLGYWWSSYNPMQHWPIVAVGFLGKIFGLLSFALTYTQGNVSFGIIYTLLTNDFIWWVPFLLILKNVHIEYKWQLT
ncbi:MAG: small multidrug resistance pump [Bacteroidia bacterium]|jgi:small multidrug resistance pump